MIDFVSHLISRHTDPVLQIRPYVRGKFEPISNQVQTYLDNDLFQPDTVNDTPLAASKKLKENNNRLDENADQKDETIEKRTISGNPSTLQISESFQPKKNDDDSSDSGYHDAMMNNIKKPLDQVANTGEDNSLENSSDTSFHHSPDDFSGRYDKESKSDATALRQPINGPINPGFTGSLTDAHNEPAGAFLNPSENNHFADPPEPDLSLPSQHLNFLINKNLNTNDSLPLSDIKPKDIHTTEKDSADAGQHAKPDNYSLQSNKEEGGLLGLPGSFGQLPYPYQARNQQEHYSGQPVIKVTIGRIEVRAVVQPASTAPVKQSAVVKPDMSLEDYLKQRNKKSL